MPSTGVTAIRAVLGAKTFSLPWNNTTYPAGFNVNGQNTIKVATAMHAGWTCATPTTPSAFAAAFVAQYAGYFTGSGNGYLFTNCIATGLDAEVAAWVASWTTPANVHTYVVNAASITARIMACAPINTPGAVAMAEAVASAFMAGFGQEVG